ncbi:MAG TPA: YciI family protein [Candidatus Angelobacter sp.]|nr:YciI family protein [Candidatus Angelobacter sp.]
MTKKLSLIAIVFLTILGIANSQKQEAAEQRQFFLVFLKRPANPPQLDKDAAEKLQGEHMANIRKMYAENKLVMAGPFISDTPLRGIFVLTASSAEEASNWASEDPAVKAGRLAVEVRGPWRIKPDAIHHVDQDAGGLEQYTLLLMFRGEKWTPEFPLKDFIPQHAAFLQDMMGKGKLAVAGPFMDRGDPLAVTIYTVAADEAIKLAQDDPLFKAGYFKLEPHAWITGKGVLAPGLPFKPQQEK